MEFSDGQLTNTTGCLIMLKSFGVVLWRQNGTILPPEEPTCDRDPK